MVVCFFSGKILQAESPVYIQKRSKQIKALYKYEDLIDILSYIKKMTQILVWGKQNM